ncbi:MAG TPA: glycosyltransferase [Nocardioides sp.]|nr:glycosyltransferase [Nocardioides sp.]
MDAGDNSEEPAGAVGRQRRDLARHPPDAALLADLDIEEAVELGWVPCEITDGTVVVGSCLPPDEHLVQEVRERFPGLAARFVACSRSEIDEVVLAERRRRLESSEEAAARPLVRPVHGLLAAAGATTAAVVAMVLPVFVVLVVLSVASLAFVAGGLTQLSPSRGPVPRRTRRREVAPSVAGSDDDRLPLYTVVVRVAGGAPGLEELFDNFRAVDYPRERTDAIFIVAEGDRDTLSALRALPSRGWVRVVKVPDREFLSVIRACDHGLALARGRYIVAYDQDERPEPDQLRRAVAVFEADLVDRLEGRLRAAPLVGLRVGRYTGPQWPTAFDRLSTPDDVLPVDDVWSGRGPVTSPDVTSIHFNTGLLRRRGGFGLLVPGPGPRSDARIETLDSSSLRGTNRSARGWLLARADRLARDLRSGGGAMFLAYPVVMGIGVVAAVRWSLDGRPADAWQLLLAFGAPALFLVGSVAVAAHRLAARGGWRSALWAVALPVHWGLHAYAAWMAAWAVALRRVTGVIGTIGRGGTA